MKFLALLFLLMVSLGVNAQRVIGVVLDRNTRELIPHAAVKSGDAIQVTDINGNFFLSNAKPTDTVRVTYMGYQVYYGLAGRHVKDTLKVYLSPIANVLRDVNIRGDRNRKLDSIQNRREFASAFNYKAPTFYDAFNKVNPYEEHHLFDDMERTNSTAQIVNVNMLAVLGLITKNKAPDSKLHDLVTKDENQNYIDERFSKKRVGSITKLQGDALAEFIYLYRPSIGALKQMSDYDLDVYIKKSYDEYKTGKNPNK